MAFIKKWPQNGCFFFTEGARVISLKIPMGFGSPGRDEKPFLELSDIQE